MSKQFYLTTAIDYVNGFARPAHAPKLAQIEPQSPEHSASQNAA